MKLIIDIPEEKYEWIVENPLVYTSDIEEAVRKGTRLDDIKSEIHDNAEMQSDGEWYLNEKWVMSIIDKHIGKEKP